MSVIETERRSPPRVIVIANQKGGVGKTTTAINLGTALAAVGERVLLVDLDPQGNASTGLGIDATKRTRSTYDVLLGRCGLDAVELATVVPRLTIAPSRLDLLGLDIELADDPDRVLKLKQALARYGEDDPEREPPTYIFVDCPPSLTLATINALAAADAVLVPLQCEFFALEGLSQLLSTIERVRTTINGDLQIQGVVLTMYDPRNSLSGQVAADVRAHLGDKVYETVIPRNVRLSEAPSHGKPVLLYDLKCAGSQAYLKLASDFIARERRAVLA